MMRRSAEAAGPVIVGEMTGLPPCAAAPDGASLSPVNFRGNVMFDNDIALLARRHGPDCIQRLGELLYSNDPVAAVAAARELLNRGFDLPLQPLTFDADGVRVEVNAATEIEEPHRTNGKSSDAWGAC
jgi:hypothetical protein